LNMLCLVEQEGVGGREEKEKDRERTLTWISSSPLGGIPNHKNGSISKEIAIEREEKLSENWELEHADVKSWH
jgi:hypothetical protein